MDHFFLTKLQITQRYYQYYMLHCTQRNELHYPTCINTHYFTLLLKKKKKKNRDIYVTFLQKFTHHLYVHTYIYTRVCTPVRDVQGRHVYTNYNTGGHEFRNCSSLLFLIAIVRITEVLFFRSRRKLSKSKLP